MTKGEFRIVGRVIDANTGRGAKGLRVEAWDKDLIFDDLVGSTITDEQGAFRIEFKASDFQELFLDRSPDLFFRVFRDGDLVKSTEDSVLWNVKVGETEITIKVDDAVIAFQQAPVRNASVVGAQVCSHSGEFSPRVVDVTIPGRGLSLKFLRKYRSGLAGQMGPLGHGWTFSYAKRIERQADEILYHDGLGRTIRFCAGSAENEYVCPPGFYSVLQAENGKFLLKQRHGSVFVFEAPEAGGRLLVIRDRNGNQLTFKYMETQLRITDTLGRDTIIEYDQNRVKKVQDHGGRVWEYKYDKHGCLIEVVQPPTDEVPEGPRIRYEYDERLRLGSITDPSGKTFLRNVYDEDDRVVRQKHGSGTFEFRYEPIGATEAGLPIYRIRVRQKNGAHLVLEHNADGHVVRRSLFVTADSLSAEDGGGSGDELVALTTLSEFNQNGEVTKRVFPAGNSTEWVYAEDSEDPRARGNLLQVTRRPAPDVESDQAQIIMRYSYEPVYQRRKSITNPLGHTIAFEYDDRGNLTQKIYPEVTVQKVDTNPAGRQTVKRQLVERFEYNAAGQFLRVIDARGAVSEYHYYPEHDPTGAQGKGGIQSDPQLAGGYLARIVQDPDTPDRALSGQAAHLVAELGYDEVGNITTIWDGKGNPTRLTYNSHNRVIAGTSREPVVHEVRMRYDANQNPVESTLSFERNVFEDQTERVLTQTATLQQRLDYSVLNNIIRRTTVADGRALVEEFERDPSENIIRKIQPMGNVAEYSFDERNLLLERRVGVGTDEETSARYTYTRNGRRRSRTNGRGETIHYQYDGFQRYRGFINAGGTSKEQWFDAAGNITRIEVTGDPGLVDEQGEPIQADPVALLETWYQYDEMNRRVRIDRAWRDNTAGDPLGDSQWDDAAGLVSTVVEYADNHRPAKAWYETGNVLSYAYDGANRVVGLSDATGESLSVKYDENGNPVLIEQLGPPEEGEKRFQNLIIQTFDSLDRLIGRSVNYEPPEKVAYNALGLVTTYTNRAGSQVQYLHDPFGRQVGRVSRAITPGSGNGQPTEQRLVSRVERDENGRVMARIDAAGQRTRFDYDALNRRTAIFYPDGTNKRFEYDAHGNLARVEDQNGNMISQSFDPLNRLVGRVIQPGDGGSPQVERFAYDGLNRIVAAAANGTLITRRYDSFSRMLEESQLGHTTRYGYDAAGNRTLILYPGGQQVRKAYDMLKRVAEVRNGNDDLITGYTYRSSGQFKQQRLGNVLEADFAYTACQTCLREVVYRSLENGTIIDGSRYLYDVAGNLTQEAQLHRGENHGERYIHDSANRLVGVQYGVKALNDPQSPFEHEVQYALSPAGTWRQKTVRDGDGQIVAQLNGETNERHAYISLGDRNFEYDANGNRVADTRDGNEDCAEKRYIHDYANRLIKTECLDTDGAATQIVEYAYDAFSRQVLRHISDAKGTRETVRVWNGRQLIEEWEDGELAKSFVYGAQVERPVQMNRHTMNGLESFFYSLNGRGLVTALVDPAGQVAERYRYDVFGQPFLSEVDGGPMDPGDQISSSPLGNLFFAGGVWDPDVGLSFGLGGGYDPDAGQVTNPESSPGEPGCGNPYSAGVDGTGFAASDRGGGILGSAVRLVTHGFDDREDSPLVQTARAAVLWPVVGMAAILQHGIDVVVGGPFHNNWGRDNRDENESHGASGGGCSSGGSDSQAMYAANEGEGGGDGGTGGGDDGGDTGGGTGGDTGGGGEGGGSDGGGGDDNGEGGGDDGNDGDDGEEGQGGNGGSGGGCGGEGGGGETGIAGLSPTDEPGGSTGALRWPKRSGGGLASAPDGGLGAGRDDPFGSGCGDSGVGGGRSGGKDSLSSRAGCSGTISTPNWADRRGGSVQGPNRVQPGSPGDVRLGCGSPLAGFAGGTNPLVVNPETLVINPAPVDNLGAMAASGGLGMLLTGMPGMGYTEPPMEDVGRGNPGRGATQGGRPIGPYGPDSSGGEFRDPTPESRGGSCGTGTSASSALGECSPF